MQRGTIKTTFGETFTELCEARGLEPKFQQARGYCNGQGGYTAEQGIEVFKTFMTALKDGTIRA